MARSFDAAAREAKIVELKHLITAGRYETLEKLEDAVDAFLWAEHDRLQSQAFLSPSASCSTSASELSMQDALAEQGDVVWQIGRSHPR